MLGQRLASAPGRTETPTREWSVIVRGGEIQFLQSRSDGGPCESGGLGDPDDPAPAKRSGFNGGPEAASPLIEERFEGDVLRFDDLSE